MLSNSSANAKPDARQIASLGVRGIDTGLLHLIVAVIALPGYFVLGSAFKLAMIPYVLYLLLRAKAAFLPALLIHFLPGSLVSQAILLGSAILPLMRWQDMLTYRLRFLYIVSALPLLLLAFLAAQRVLTLGMSTVEAGVFLGLYLGLFGFFYGVLVARQVDRRVLMRILWILVIVVFVQIAVPTGASIRYVNLGLPLLAAIAFAALLNRREIGVSRPLFVALLFTLGLFVVGGSAPSFAILLSMLTSMLLVFIVSFGKRKLAGVSIGRAVPPLAILAMLFLLWATPEQVTLGIRAASLQDARSWGELVDAFEFKAYGDRGLLWRGAWATIVAAGNVWPPFQPPPIEYLTYRGVIREVTFEAHNVGLELLRQYGFVVGFIGTGTYLVMVSLVGRVFSRRSLGLPVVFGAAVFAMVVVFGLVGQVVLQNTLSFLALGLGGVVYGLAKDRAVVDAM